MDNELAPTWLTRLAFTEGLGTLCPAPDDKIMAFGDSDAGQAQFTIARLNANGNLDTAFGDQGFIRDQFPAEPDAFFFGLSAHQDADGKTLLVGALYDDDLYPAVARFLADGKADHSFGTKGKVAFKQLSNADSTASVSQIKSMRTQSPASTKPGAISLAGGGYLIASAETGYLICLHEDGTLNPEFAGTGYLRPRPAHVQNFELTHAFVLAERIYVVGSAAVQGVVASYTLAGLLDPTFGEEGSCLITYPDASKVGLMAGAEGSEGTLSVTGFARTNNQNAALLCRLSVTGEIIPGFPLLLSQDDRQSDYRYVASSLSEPLDERIFTVGQSTDRGAGDPRFLAAAYYPDGCLDTDFTGNGWGLGPVSASAYGMYLRSPTSLLIGGRIRKVTDAGYEGFVARYPLNPEC